MRNLIGLLTLLFSVSLYAQPGPPAAAGSSLVDQVETLKAEVATLQAQVAALLALAHDKYTDAEAVAAADPDGILSSFSKVGSSIYLDDTDLHIDGGNLHVVNGLGVTETANEYGNIIIGYNESRGSGDDRSGSHMLVVGARNNYSSYGGIVVGDYNETSGIYSSVSSGIKNIASGQWSSVSGGIQNIASADASSVSGGLFNTASEQGSSVSGGRDNTASGIQSSVSGGKDNIASSKHSSVSGGQNNEASGDFSSILGGVGQSANGVFQIIPTLP